MHRDTFLKEYVLELETEFELDGKPAEWAPSTSGGPLLWGQEHSSMDLTKPNPKKNDRFAATMALSPDSSFLAVATGAVIRIYTSDSKDLTAELIGHLQDVSKLTFVPGKTKNPDGAKYALFSQSRDNGGSSDEKMIAWYLDGRGKQLNRVMPFAIENLADKAMEAISEDLTYHHEMDKSAVADLRGGFVDVLIAGDTKNRMRDLPSWDGESPGFGSKFISCDQKSFFIVDHGRTTQHGMRPPDQLPQIVVKSFSDLGGETCRLKGHKDAIMWASWSPTDPKTIASAGWDEMYRIWDAETGECRHEIGPTGGQNWSGDFSPDGKYVLLSGTNNVAIYNVETGEKQVTLEGMEGLKLASWIRYLSWAPSGDTIAFGNGSAVVLWEPFPDNKTEIILKCKEGDRIMNSFQSFSRVKWLDTQGHKLALGDGENSYFIWDRKQNWKWRFQRPQGTPLEMGGNKFVYNDETKTLICLDGDMKIREWKL